MRDIRDSKLVNYSDKLSKFKGCDRIFCIKSSKDFDAGKVYNCKIIIDSENNISIHIMDIMGIFYCYDSLRTLESFCTLAEHRKKVIEDL